MNVRKSVWTIDKSIVHGPSISIERDYFLRKIKILNFKVLKRAQPTLLQKYTDPLMAIGHDQTQFEIPVVDHIVDKTMDGLNLRNPVATDLLTKGIWFKFYYQ